MPEKIYCKVCGAEYDASARICTRCGVDLRTGKPLQTVVGPPVADDDEDDGDVQDYTAWQKLVMGVGWFFPGLFSLRVVLLGSLMLIAAAVAGGFAVFFLALGAIFATFSVGAFAIILYAHAVAWVLLGRVQSLRESLAEFDARAWALFAVAVWGPIIAALAWAKHVAG